MALKYNEYDQEIKNARRHFLTGEIVLSDLSAGAKRYLKKKKTLNRKRLAKSYMSRYDKRLYYNKWYPWCYKGEIPTVYPQGFYDLWYPKKKLLLTYGPNALEHIRWIKGIDAVEKDFAIGKSLFINGSWTTGISRIYYPPEIAYNRNHKSYRIKIKQALCKGSAKDIEKSLVKVLKKYMANRPILIKKPKKVKANLKPTLF